MNRIVALGLLVTFAAVANADTVFTAVLDGAQEVPPNSSTAFGSATLVLNDAQNRLEISISTTGLDLDGLQTPETGDNLTVAHIHAAPFGSNGGVVFGFVGPNSDLNGDLVIDPVAGTIFSAWDLNEGNNTTLGAQLGNLFSEGLYINLHTMQFTGGEIRGQIVPEPATIGMLLLAVGGLALRRR